MLVHMGRIIRLGGKMKDEGTLTTYEERRANAMNNNHQGSKKHDRKNWKPFKLWPENYWKPICLMLIQERAINLLNNLISRQGVGVGNGVKILLQATNSSKGYSSVQICIELKMQLLVPSNFWRGTKTHQVYGFFSPLFSEKRPNENRKEMSTSVLKLWITYWHSSGGIL